MTDNKNDKTKVDLGLLEEDDEFEEFPAEDWTAKDEDSDDISVWEDNWDDDDVEDDFNQQLRLLNSISEKCCVFGHDKVVKLFSDLIH
ncbi:PREDICTED: 26S proteasome complex subunit DSS1 isoform X1 [Atta cephalotes]|uniref:26S proteasome complex subunit SEM1 n=1 Tax=Atta cephalotes TaxID=12957 RepID=A0A158NXS1_ATTCE|nr:PREDICTED: 26S proteasome complex subunit DSS1 isoform X1 [Atta cephalotes]